MDNQTVGKVPLGLFRRTSAPRARIEVFFASAELRQKTDFKCLLRRQKTLFRQAEMPPAKPPGASEYQLVSLTAGITQRRESRCPP